MTSFPLHAGGMATSPFGTASTTTARRFRAAARHAVRRFDGDRAQHRALQREPRRRRRLRGAAFDLDGVGSWRLNVGAFGGWGHQWLERPGQFQRARRTAHARAATTRRTVSRRSTRTTTHSVAHGGPKSARRWKWPVRANPPDRTGGWDAISTGEIRFWFQLLTAGARRSSPRAATTAGGAPWSRSGRRRDLRHTRSRAARRPVSTRSLAGSGEGGAANGASRS